MPSKPSRIDAVDNSQLPTAAVVAAKWDGSDKIGTAHTCQSRALLARRVSRRLGTRHDAWVAAFPNLHDATLVGVDCLWAEARLIIRLEVRPDHDIELVASGLQTLSLARRQPWGPSASVNEATLSSIDGTQGPRTLRLEMQSGDEILVVAREITVFDPQG